MIDYHKTMDLGRRLLDKHGLVDWKFDVINLNEVVEPDSECALGLCHVEQKTIYIDFRAQKRNARQIILHEIAHALTPGAAHGEVWLKMAGDIGCTFVMLLRYYQDLRVVNEQPLKLLEVSK